MVLKDLRLKISNEINESGLPIDAIYFVLKDIYNEVIEVMNQQIEIENAAAAQGSGDPEDKMEEATPAAQIEEKEEN